jgi:hypothetical protein
VRRLATPFKEWEAFKLGIIDENGKVLKKRKDLTLAAERKAFGVFDVMILNIKKLLAKVPGGSTRIASYAAALYLIREWNHFSDSSMLTEDISDQTIEESIEVFYDRYVNYIHLQEIVNQKSDLNESFEEFFLNELFDKPYPFNLNIQNLYARASVILPDRSRLVVSLMKKKEGEWDLIFERGGSIDATGAGDQNRVFSTVLAVVDEFIQKVNPEKIMFGADKVASNSRSKLYTFMLQRFAKNAGYNFSSQDRYGATYFTLMKEYAPTMNVGSGAIAGLGVGPQGEPGLTASQMKKYKKKTKTPKRLRDVIGAKL